jgi:hypothetical protein
MCTIYAAAIALFRRQMFTRRILSPSAGSPSPPTCSPVVDQQGRCACAARSLLRPPVSPAPRARPPRAWTPAVPSSRLRRPLPPMVSWVEEIPYKEIQRDNHTDKL